jgi:hypothetical protein
MAESEIEAFNALHRLLGSISGEAVQAADEAAAAVFLAAAKAAAPVKTGQLQRSIKIITSAKSSALASSLQGNIAPRMWVSPEKKTGYYGFFVERGWVTVGSRRRGRASTGSTHSQRGAQGGHKVPGRPWFDPAIAAAEEAAVEAAESAFNAKLGELDT